MPGDDFWAPAAVTTVAAVGAAAYCFQAAVEQSAALALAEQALQAERAAHEITEAYRKQEKAGRSRSERDKRELLRQVNTVHVGTEYPLVPIGVARSCFLDCSGTPRQPGLCPGTRSRLEFDKRLGPEAFDGLAEHSHVWIIYIFHRNTNSDRTLAHLPVGKTFPSKVKPPRRRGTEQPKLGCMGTRTPHRPNPIGLSLGVLVKLDASKRHVIIAGTDLVDGTPVSQPRDALCDAV